MNLSECHSTAWGIEGYEIPSQYFDHEKIAKDKEYYAFNVGKKKRPNGKRPNPNTKKEMIIETVAKRAASIPPPWTYDVALKWSENTKNVPNKEAQISKYKWLGVAKDDMNIETSARIRPKKVDMSVKKYTYIDWIIIKNTNENYPRPGPNNYFMDNKTAKKYFENDIGIIDKKEKSIIQKNNLPLYN